MSLRTQHVSEILGSLGSKAPTPGGGAVAGLAGAIASATGRMVVAYSEGKKGLEAHAGELTAAAEKLERARDLFLELADEDAEAYGALNELWRLPRTDPRRGEMLVKAAERAASVPEAVVAASNELLRLLESLIPISNKQLSSDLAVAAVLAESAARAAAWNVRANLPLLEESARDAVRERAERGIADAQARAESIEQACAG